VLEYCTSDLEQLVREKDALGLEYFGYSDELPV
jgi:hypothetical protein